MTCTGLAASWCPVHGDCVCLVEAIDEAHEMTQPPYAVAVPEFPSSLDSPRCPLHRPGSTHGDRS